jgi:glycosyltransferase involved in cell wall biosynthesis
MNQKELSIIISSYQKKEWLQRTIDVLLKYFPEAEIIVINDGSQDNTEKIKNIFGNRIVYLGNEKNQGKGFSLRKGFKEANGQYLIFTDDDLPYGIESIQDVLQELKTGAEVVIGERHDFYNDKLLKKLLRPLLYLFLEILFGFHYFDTQAGLKGFKRETGKTIFSLTFTDRFAIDVEILYLSRKLGYSVKTILIKQQNFGPSKFNLKDIMKMFFDLFKIRLHHYYEKK